MALILDCAVLILLLTINQYNLGISALQFYCKGLFTASVVPHIIIKPYHQIILFKTLGNNTG